jgi:hypothetical protein
LQIANVEKATAHVSGRVYAAMPKIVNEKALWQPCLYLLDFSRPLGRLSLKTRPPRRKPGLTTERIRRFWRSAARPGRDGCFRQIQLPWPDSL